jgi:hypothetical protein
MDEDLTKPEITDPDAPRPEPSWDLFRCGETDTTALIQRGFANLIDVITCHDFVSTYGRSHPVLVKFLSDSDVLSEYIAILANAHNRQIHKTFRSLFLCHCPCHVVESALTMFAGCARCVLESADGADIAPFVRGVLLGSFVAAFQKNVALCVDLMQASPDIAQILFANIDHTAVAYGLAAAFKEAPLEALDFLIWHLFVALVGERPICCPPTRCNDQEFNYPAFTPSQKIVVGELLSTFFKYQSNKNWHERHFQNAMILVFEHLTDFEPEFLDIARYLPDSDVVMERARLFFKESRCAFSLDYFENRLSHEEAASLLINVFGADDASGGLFLKARKVIDANLAKGGVGPLVAVFPFVWNACLAREDEVAMSCVLDTAVRLPAGRSQGWRRFAVSVIAPWVAGEAFAVEEGRFPEEDVDAEAVERIRRILAPGE